MGALIASLIILSMAASDRSSPILGLSADGKAFEVRTATVPEYRVYSHKKLATIFQVRVKGNDSDEDVPPVLGEYQLLEDRIRFIPRFPPMPGTTYRLRFEDQLNDITVPIVDHAPRTAVAAIYPSANHLPENTLRFYVQFTRSMNLKDIYRHVRLIRDDGQQVDTPFLELDEQLWSADGTRLTLLCDPGRVKRGLVPRLEAGPILEEGRRYTLVIDRQWRDAEGRPLVETACKTFTVGPPNDTPVNPSIWMLVPPHSGGTQPLVIRLPEPLNRALLERMIWVETQENDRVACTVTVGGGERVVTFVPDKPWRRGTYRLHVDTRLEDLCGNRVGEPFEVDQFKPIEQTIQPATVTRTFMVR